MAPSARQDAARGRPRGCVVAAEVYEGIVERLPAITAVSLLPFERPPRLLDRLGGEALDAAELADARERHEAGVEFREAFLAPGLARPVAESVLDAALFHQPDGPRALLVDRDEVLAGGLERAAERADLSRPWALLSRVEVGSGGERHLPLLDFACGRSPAALESVVRAARQLLEAPFHVLETTGSYHLVFERLLSASQAAEFLGRALLLGPLVDRAYVGHQLIEGRSALRVSAVGETPAPTLCHEARAAG